MDKLLNKHSSSDNQHFNPEINTLLNVNHLGVNIAEPVRARKFEKKSNILTFKWDLFFKNIYEILVTCYAIV